VNAARPGTVEASIAKALDGTSDRDRTATRRVLERLAAHLDPAMSAAPAGRSRAAEEGSDT
jgi:hypothetical protein